MMVITETLQTGYPQTVSNQNGGKGLVYGYVEVPEGIEMWPCLLSAQDTVIVSTSAYHCRACYDATNEDVVEIIVPGYGAFTTKLDDRVQFIPDTTTPSFHFKRRDKWIDISFKVIENVELLFDVLHGDRDAIQHELDLNTLATACPSIRELNCTNFDVVLTDHNEALKSWPIQEILFERIGRVSALVSCLRNSNLRMARELVDITVMYLRESTDAENLRWLEAQKGKYLPVTKKKLDARMKAAMISVVTSGQITLASTDRKVIRYLDANILSLIFVFTSTPAQRLVWLYG
ncbi:hypothetical protein PHMEG_00030895 [Phytophthora megakarya]|uniref:Uncharacterized protein n=1 Tax=Phytophthora megakarya TaxID=4795 RepID=A0A225V1S1_9STRA|nr:hypothetical protein PHMEG_00030895 [Phytophthora megakarya]